MKKNIILFLTLVFSFALRAQNNNLIYVNPFIGTGGHGHTYPGVTVPFGMVQVSPDTRLSGWDGCSGYHYSDSLIYGFSHTHLSGTGVSDYGDILLMPTMGKILLNNGANGKPGYRSTFDKSTEMASTGLYSVYLKDKNIEVGLMATARCAYHVYDYHRPTEQNIILDLLHRDELLGADFQQINDTTIQGYRFSKAWAKEQRIYFYLQFSTPMKLESTTTKDGKNLVGGFKCIKNANNFIHVKIGISPISIDNAKLNLVDELPRWFEMPTKLQVEGIDKWERMITAFQIESPNEDDKSNFFTSLYHLYQVPNLVQDVDNQYLGMDLKAHKATDHTHYTVFSLWDTYRAAHPLYTILQPKRVNDFVKTFLDDFDKSGALPMWSLPGNETWCMIGNHAIPVIADAYLKGLTSEKSTSVNDLRLLDAMIKTTEINHFGQREYAKFGFIPAEMEHESVSKTLEYAYDDYCIAQMAKSLGKNDIYTRFIKRAQNYKNVSNPENGFVQAKINQTWLTPFAPEEVNSHFTEGNSWHYSFSAPHDMAGWLKLQGGKAAAEAKLDALFEADTQTSGREQADLTGMLGQYAQGNEPSHHIAYLYNFVGKPHKTQAMVHQIMNDFYKNQPDGLIGNEDCGQMSAWYIFSAMGFYPVNPCGGQYIIGTPRFPKLELKVGDNKTLTIKAIDVSNDNYYIQSATLNGKALTRSWLMHDEIMNGGELVFKMGDRPSSWATAAADNPVTEIVDNQIVPIPFVAKGERNFMNSAAIELGCADKDAVISYILGAETAKSYTTKIDVSQSSKLTFWAYNPKTKQVSDTVSAAFTKIPVNRAIAIKNKYAPQYAAGGDNALIDFIKGEKNYHTGAWQGYEGVDCEVVIDLLKETNLTSIGVGVLQDQNAWIFAPTSVEFFISNDNVNFESFHTFKNEIDEHLDAATTQHYSIKKAGKARYVKVVAKNRGFCPDWHKGAEDEGKAWIFLDEISIE